MIIQRQPLKDVFQTAREMRRLVIDYWADLGAWLDADFMVFFNFVCALPYVPDPPSIETVSRPLYTLRHEYTPRDCDDKAVLIASWLHGNGIRARFVAVSTQQSRELNHVFTQAENGLDLDATYNEYHGMLGGYPYFPDVTAREDLTDFF